MTPSLDTVPISWPANEAACEQMTANLAELKSCAFVNDAFVRGLEDWERPDLAEIARARMRLWGAEDDAIARAAEILNWTFREVVRPSFNQVPNPGELTFESAGRVVPALRELADRDLDHWRRDNDELAYERHSLYTDLMQACDALRLVPRRISIAEARRPPRRQFTPAWNCARVASEAAGVLCHAETLHPTSGAALDRLGAPDFSMLSVDRRSREALTAAGIKTFGPRLEGVARAITDRYDAARLTGPVDVGGAVALAAAIRPVGADAFATVAESPELAARPIPHDTPTLSAGAERVLEATLAEIAVHLHTLSVRSAAAPRTS